MCSGTYSPKEAVYVKPELVLVEGYRPSQFPRYCVRSQQKLLHQQPSLKIYDELKKRNTELLGLSVDSVSSHIACIRNCEEKMGVKIPFPIIADLNKRAQIQKEGGKRRWFAVAD